MSNNRKIGEKIKLTREKIGISVEDLAGRAGIGASMIEKIEAGSMVPYLSPLIKISRALGVRLGTFLDDQQQLGPVVSRKSSMAEVERFRGKDEDSNDTRTFFSLAMNKSSRHMEPLIVELEGSDSGDSPLSSHEGEEFVYVLDGEVEILYGKETYSLSAGDSIYYDSIVEHDVRAASGSSARILAVVHEPS